MSISAWRYHKLHYDFFSYFRIGELREGMFYYHTMSYALRKMRHEYK